MATVVNINGKTIKRPGVYALTKSGIKYPPLSLPYGNIVIIDSGLGKEFVGGSGVNGKHTQGTDSVYQIDTIQKYRDFVKGGPLWDIATQLFKPYRSNINGVSSVFIVKAATTTCAEIAYTFKQNGKITFETLDEGVGVNGVKQGDELVKGYGIKLVKGKTDATKYVFEFYHGSFTGVDSTNNVAYDGVPIEQSKPVLLFQSKEVENVQQLVDWCNSSNEFRQVFKIKPGSVTTTGVFEADDITDNVGYKLATGGTETYGTADFDAALKAVKDVDHTFFLSTEFGDNSTSLNNEKILDFIVNQSKYEKFLVVGGGFDKLHFTGASNTSESTAKHFNSDKVIVVHGGYKTNTRQGTMIKTQFHKAALVLGRLCGLEPQTPITFKGVNIDAEVHKLDDEEKEFALDHGILTTHYDSELGYHIVQQGINSMQTNRYLVEEDGSSHDIAVKRITAQLNKEICVNAKLVFFNKEKGPNRATMSEQDISSWLKGFLQNKVASTLDDNLIVRFGNIRANIEGDNIFVSYEFVPNYPISKVIFTGIILEK